MDVWVCGKYHGHNTEGTTWAFQGVFSTKGKAIAACKSQAYFIGPAKIDDIIPDETIDWPGCYYPRAEGEPPRG